jgi:hypothetical protein
MHIKVENFVSIPPVAAEFNAAKPILFEDYHLPSHTKCEGGSQLCCSKFYIY